MAASDPEQAVRTIIAESLLTAEADVRPKRSAQLPQSSVDVAAPITSMRARIAART